MNEYTKPVLVTANKKIAVEPFGDMSVKTSAQGPGSVKVARIENKATLTRLRVLFSDSSYEYNAGDEVLVRSDLYLQPWAKEKFEFEGTTFILLPEQYIDAVIRFQS